MHANVRSLSKNLNNLVTLLRLLNNEISCIGIYRSWLNTSIPTNMFDIHKYAFVHKSRKPERGGGVGISIKNANKYKEKTDLTIFEDGMFESIFIKVENINSVKTLIGAIYRPPNHANRDIFLEQMQIIWQNMTMNKTPSYVVGDFNIDLLSSEASFNILDQMSSHCFKPHISTPTRLNNEGNHASLIDSIFTNTNNESYSGKISYDISDHLPIYYCAYNNCNNNNNNNIFNNQTTHARVLGNLSKTDINNFINEISKEKWTQIYAYAHVHVLHTYYTTYVLHAYY